MYEGGRLKMKKRITAFTLSFMLIVTGSLTPMSISSAEDNILQEDVSEKVLQDTTKTDAVNQEENESAGIEENKNEKALTTYEETRNSESDTLKQDYARTNKKQEDANKSRDWEFKQIKFSLISPQKTGSAITINPVVEGKQDGLQFKYVWMKNGWKENGTIQNFSNNNTAEWKPLTSGKYQIYVDIKDKSGEVQTKSAEFEILAKKWNYVKVKFGSEPSGIVGGKVDISPTVEGETEGLEYKYVWMKNGWKENGTIQNFSSSATAEWIPTSSGEYTIYVDVKDEEGKIVTKSAKYQVEDAWKHKGVRFSEQAPQKVGDKITILPSVEGKTEGLEYKYVWMKNGWKESGTIQNFSSNATAEWIPTSSGEYWIYVDIRDQYGNVVTKSAKYRVEDAWKHEGVGFSQRSTQPLGSTITIEPKISGDTEGLEYKYVWMKNGWKESGTIQQFSEKTTAQWTPSEEGLYYIYVDVKDKYGNTSTKNAHFRIGTQKWNYGGVSFGKTSPQKSGSIITIKPNVSGDIVGLQYKFVWMKNGWKESGTIQNFSEKNTAEWKPKTNGEYWIYVDVKDETGKIITKNASFKIGGNSMALKAQSYSSSTKWLVLVDTTQNRVGIYSGYKNNWTETKYWVCTTGARSTPTVKGTFTVKGKGMSFGKGYTCWYYTQFYGNYLFHSVLYYPGSKTAIKDGRLGINASHGCVRLSLYNAKWIYDNIPRGTKVVIY